MPYWILPGGLALLGIGLWTTLAPESPLLAEAARGYPYVLLAAAVLLAWRFQKSRIAAAALLLALAHLALTAGTPVLLLAAATLFPLSIGALALTDDRGLFSRAGLIQLQLGVALPLLLAALAFAAPAETERLLGTWAAAPWGRGEAPLPRIATLSFLAGAALAGAAAARRRRATEAGLLWLLPAALLMLQAPAEGVARGGWLLAGAAVLLVAVVEASYAMAYHDELTGLPARRALRRMMGELQPPYAVAVVDIDHFKRVNDRFGHDVGDQVLRMVAAQLARVGGGGRAYRSGGEEFTLLFPGLSRDEASELAEALRQSVETSPFKLRGRDRPRRKPAETKRSGKEGRSLAVTVSIGVAQSNGRRELPDDVVKAADQALYKAKKRGRNRVA